MNAELNNDINNNDTVEQAQNQNGAGRLATSDVAPAPDALDVAQAAQPAVPPTADRLPNQSCAATQPMSQPAGKSAAAEIPESTNPVLGPDHGQLSQDQSVPATDNGPLATDQPANNPEIHESSNPIDQGPRTTDQNNSSLQEPALEADPACEATAAPFRATWPLPPPGQRNRKGKVASLPPDVLEWVNLQLLDEVPYAAILDELADRGYSHITQQNITSWKTCGGYNQWLSGHMARQERRSELETVCALITQSRGRLDEAALFLVSNQLLSVVGDFDLSSFKKHLAEDPQTYLRLIQTLTKLNKVRQTSKKITQTNFVNKPGNGEGNLEVLPDAERGLTEETLKKITDAIRLF